MPDPTHILAIKDRGAQVKDLQSALRKLGYEIPRNELDEQVFGAGTKDALLKLQSKFDLPRTGALDEKTRAALASDAAGTETGKYRVEGRIFLENGVPAGKLAIRLYSKGYGGESKMLAEVKTDDMGFYAASYDPGKRAVNLEVRAVGPQGKEIPLTSTKFNAGKHEVLNLGAPASVKSFEAEYQRIAADLTKQLGDLGKLAATSEEQARHDITLLHQSTGWDARLIAIAATSVKLSSETGVPQDALYALLRAGLPADKQLLARVSAATVEKALGKGREAGIVRLDDQQIDKAKTAFDSFVKKNRRAAKAAGAPSSFDDLLGKSELDNNEKLVFEDLFFAHGGPPDELWEKAGKKGIPEEKIKGLKLQGKLAYLTHNNAALAEDLQKKIKTAENLGVLVDGHDLYKGEAWEKLINGIAGGVEEALKKLIPPAYEGEKTSDRLKAYADDLARKVRVNFPTQVVRRKIEKGDLLLGKENTIKEGVVTFLKNSEKKGFAFGKIPLSAFIRQHKDDVFKGIGDAWRGETQNCISLLQRLYQITPDDDSLGVLLRLDLKSANEIAEIPLEAFLERFGEEFDRKDKAASHETARLVWRKAQHVNAVTFNFFAGMQQMSGTPAISVLSGSQGQREEAISRLNDRLKDSPTMESLFGSLDFCECEHCRSVISPAAYFVDLLKFLDPDEKNWESALDAWKAKHNNAPYPFTDPSIAKSFTDNWKNGHGGAPYPFKTAAEWDDFRNKWKAKHGVTADPDPGMRLKPYNILVERRPDLPCLPLTCENTHTALPYIDVVNEILEHYVANKGVLDENAVHDTGEASSPELLAEPQNILASAYEELESARYPLTLPFDQPLESARSFFEHFETSLWEILETFRQTDGLFDSSKSYDRAAVFAEYLRISPAEYEIFTGADPLAKWWEIYGYKDETEALAEAYNADRQRIDLNSAKALSRRLGVTYKELAEIVQTSFVNPALEELSIVWKLRLDVSDIAEYFRRRNDAGYRDQKQAFEKRLAEFDEIYKNVSLDSGDELERLWNSGVFKKTLVLRDASGLCNFDKTSFGFAVLADTEPEKSGQEDSFKLAMVKINLFVRLWKKSGWTIEETDKALYNSLPKNSRPLSKANFGGALKTALIYIAHLRTLDEKLSLGKMIRLKLLALWSDISTAGKRSLYSQLFLTSSVLKSDPVFDHPLGKYLCYSDAGQYKPFRWDRTRPEDVKTGNVSLKSHITALQAALNMTDDEIGRVLKDAGKDFDTAELSVANASLLYRYGLLARALKITVRELISLKSLSGLDPFKPLSASPILTLDDDFPFVHTIRFVEAAEKIRESGFKIGDLDYLLSHRFDPVGKYRQNTDALLTLIKDLADGIRRIRAEQAIPADASSLTDDLLRQKISMVLQPGVVDMFFGFWKDTIEFTARKEGVDPKKKLDPATYQMDGVIRVAYDETRNWQSVTHAGVLTDAKKAEILSKVPVPEANAPQDKKDAYANFKNLLDDIAAQSQPRPKEFFDKHFEGFLTYETVFGAAAGLSTEKRRQILLNAISLFVQQRLIRQFIVQTLAADMNAEPALIDMLLTARKLPAALTQPGEPLIKEPGQANDVLLNAFEAAADSGVSADFFDAAGARVGGTVTAGTADTAINVNGVPIKPALADKVRFEGYFEVPAQGAYRFFVSLGKKDSEAELRLAHLTDPLLRGKAERDGDELDEFTELKPGVRYLFTLEAGKLGGGDAKLLVQGEKGIPKGALSQLTLYTYAGVRRACCAQVLLTKILQLSRGLGLNERELRHVLTHRADFDDLDLSKFPMFENDGSAANPATLFKQFIRLEDYRKLKGELAGGTDDLIGVFENARRIYPKSIGVSQAQTEIFNDLCRRIAGLARREEAIVRAMATHLGFGNLQPTLSGDEIRVSAPDFTQEKGLRRLWEALRVLEKLGVAVNSVQDATRVLNSSIPFNERFQIAQRLKNTIKARYATENWLRIAQPIFDKLRQRQRDALVAYIMHTEGFERIERLFEYFLLDPGMEPVVQTSRLQLAISSVQLFIQRCLLNLEDSRKVHPSAITSKHWEWMKRYRIWEANRKIFLFPENWLEPEFRDDKTYLFEELESALLQGDVSNDLAEDAFFKYLRKLEEISRLDIVTIYCEEKDDPGSNVLHVIGQTYSLPHKYFYRKCAHHMWTPWEPVPAEIEGDHVSAVVWRDRLHLFWVTFLEKAEPKEVRNDSNEEATFSELAEMKLSRSAPLRMVEIQLNWSEYFQGKWTERESSGFGDPIRVAVDNDFNSRDVFIYTHKEYDAGEDSAVIIDLVGGRCFTGSNSKKTAFRVISKNNPPELVNTVSPQATPFSINGVQATRYTGSGELSVTYVEDLTTENGKQVEAKLQQDEKIIDPIRANGSFSMLSCASPATWFDSLVSIIGKVRSNLSLIHGLPSFTDVIEKIIIFTETLPLRLNDPSEGTITAISKEWKAIKGDILRLESDISRGGSGLSALAGNASARIIMSCVTILLSVIDILLQELAKPENAAMIADAVRSYIRKYISPFFYQDEKHTFFVEPTLTETTIEEWEEWVITVPKPDKKFEDDDVWRDLPVEAEFPEIDPHIWKDPRVPGWVDPIDPISLFGIRAKKDWVTDPATVLRFDRHFMGREGLLDLAELPAVGGFNEGSMSITVNPGSELKPGMALVSAGGSGLKPGVLNVVGGSGLNRLIMDNLNTRRGALSAGLPGGRRAGEIVDR